MQATTQAALHDAITRAFRQLTAVFTARAAHDPTALRRPDYALLGAVERHESLRPSDVAAADGHDLSTISRRISGVVSEGWLAREPDPDDRRAQRVTLTAEGRRRLHAERAARAEVVTDVLGHWSDEDLATLTDLLDRLSADVAAARLEPVTERTPA